jgi:ATP adenylyltransferase
MTERGLDRLWAGWRSEYVGVADESNADGCVFCRILASDESDSETFVVWRGQSCAAVLNAYPYASGHVLVMPVRHVSDLDQLALEESAELWAGLNGAVAAIKAAYQPDGLNLGANIGRAAGAGIPNHLHLHAVPRWTGDTNFATSVAETRVLPEALPVSYDKLRKVWPT